MPMKPFSNISLPYIGCWFSFDNSVVTLGIVKANRRMRKSVWKKLLLEPLNKRINVHLVVVIPSPSLALKH